MAMEQATGREQAGWVITPLGMAALQEWRERQRRQAEEVEADMLVWLTPKGKRMLRRMHADGQLDR